jgi:ABC-2 type transport system permease protein
MKLYLQYFSIHLKSALQHKASFVMTMVGQGMTTLFSFASLYFLLDRFGNIKGYSFSEVLLCFSSIFMSFALAEGVARGFDTFSGIISNGQFDRMMVRPRSEILQVLGSRIELTKLGRVLPAMAALLYAIVGAEFTWTAQKKLTLFLMIGGGVVLFMSLFLIYATICFFTLEGLEVMNIFTDGGRELAQYPLDIYKKGVMRFFTFFVPLALVNYYPFLYLIDRNPYPDYFGTIAPLGTLLFLGVSYGLWRIGVKHYQSTGS